MKSIQFLFGLLFFLTPLVFFPQTSEVFEFNKMLLTYGLTILIVGLWVIKMIYHKQIIFRRTILDIPLVIFLTTQFISTIISIDPRTSFLGYYSRFNGGFLSLTSYSLIYWAFVSNMTKNSTLRLIRMILVSGIIVSVWGILEHFGHSPSCLIIRNTFDVGCWVQDVQSRVFATLGQPNWLAAYLVAVIPLAWYFKSWFWTGVSLLFYLGLLYTKSRSGLVGFGAVLVIFGIGSLKQSLKSLVILALCILAISAFVGTPWTPSLLQKPTPKAQETLGQGTESAQIRKIVWQGAIKLWQKYPILGTGVETFAHTYWQTRLPEHNLISEWDFLYNKAHNEYLNFAATTGTLGLSAYLFLIAASLYLFIKPKLNLHLLAGYGSILVTNFFGFSVVPIALLFFIYPAMAISLQTKKAIKLKNPKLDLLQKISIGTTVTAMIYLIFLIGKYWYGDFIYTRAMRSTKLNNFSTALADLKQATDLWPREPIFHDELAKTYSQLALAFWQNNDATTSAQLAEAAINKSLTAVALSPKNVKIKKSQANIFINLGEINPSLLVQALQTLQELTTLAPSDAKNYYLLGATWLKLGNTSDAIANLETALELKPDYKIAQEILEKLRND